MPFLEIRLGTTGSLFLFRITLPGLVGLLVRTPVGLLPGIVKGCFFAHRIPPDKEVIETAIGSTSTVSSNGRRDVGVTSIPVAARSV
jgi:hypothetical protein